MPKIYNKVCGMHRWADKIEEQVSKQRKISEGNKKCKQILEEHSFYRMQMLKLKQ